MSQRLYGSGRRPGGNGGSGSRETGRGSGFYWPGGDDDTGRRLLAELESRVNTRYTRVVKEADRRNRRCWWTAAGSVL